MSDATTDGDGNQPPQARTQLHYVEPNADEQVDVTTLTLEQLRERRRDLSTRESHVSYWRRIIQARLDLLEDGVVAHGATKDGLHRVLTRRLGVNNRLGLLSVQPSGPQPLAGLDHLWHRTITASPEESEELDAQLHQAEQELSRYRTELHDLIDETTSELIRRLHDDPGLVMSILPQRRERPSPL